MPVYEDNTKSIGRTPLVRINRLDASSGATILAKIEGRNPAYSGKCRIGAAMVWDAEERGTLKPGMSIVEATSGNTGIALAYAAAEPDKYLLEKQFENPANPAIHEKTTGPEIWEDTQGKIDVFVSGVGTGGTLTGDSRYIKHTRS